MNQRIQELYTQALENKFDYGGGLGVKPGEYYSNYKTVLNVEKFAELIVRECAKRVDYWESRQGEHSDDLLKHFGVE
jgi:hypothetical protein